MEPTEPTASCVSPVREMAWQCYWGCWAPAQSLQMVHHAAAAPARVCLPLAHLHLSRRRQRGFCVAVCSMASAETSEAAAPRPRNARLGARGRLECASTSQVARLVRSLAKNLAASSAASKLGVTWEYPAGSRLSCDQENPAEVDPRVPGDRVERRSLQQWHAGASLISPCPVTSSQGSRSPQTAGVHSRVTTTTRERVRRLITTTASSAFPGRSSSLLAGRAPGGLGLTPAMADQSEPPKRKGARLRSTKSEAEEQGLTLHAHCAGTLRAHAASILARAPTQCARAPTHCARAAQATRRTC